jgi:hypothetical protein
VSAPKLKADQTKLNASDQPGVLERYTALTYGSLPSFAGLDPEEAKAVDFLASRGVGIGTHSTFAPIERTIAGSSAALAVDLRYVPRISSQEAERIGFRRVVPQVVQRPRPRFTPLQRWEGFVAEVTSDSFIARLADLDATAAPEEEAEILLLEVAEDDRHLVMPGAGFYWTIGYKDHPSGERERVSSVRFKRLPGLDARDLARARAAAAKTIGRLGWR